MNVSNKLSCFLAISVVYGFLLQSSHAGERVILKTLQNADLSTDSDEFIVDNRFKNYDPRKHFDEKYVNSLSDPYRQEYGSELALYSRNTDKTNVKRGWEDIAFVLDEKPPRKRGWEVISDEISALVGHPVLKRALEMVREMWQIPEIRERYMEYVRAGKRSKESVVNVPVQSGSMNQKWMIDQIGYDDEGMPLYLSNKESEIPEVILDLSKRQWEAEDGREKFDCGLNDPLLYSANFICPTNEKPKVSTYDPLKTSFVSPSRSLDRLMKQGYDPKVTEELEDMSTDSKRGWETLGWKRGFIPATYGDASSYGYQHYKGVSETGLMEKRPLELLTLKQNGHINRAIDSVNNEGVNIIDTDGFLIKGKRKSIAEMFDGYRRLVSIPPSVLYPIKYEHKRGWESFKWNTDDDLSGSNFRRNIFTILNRMRKSQHAKSKRGWEFVGGWKRSTRPRRSAEADRPKAFINRYGPDTKRAWEGILWKRLALGITDT
ncbi:hypothetical protein DPMN_034710 [Dreissena polymorpha]|uniref:Uncharacterized protein n=1 Tax=Dreissena polymorpha TaxID=45954 RepID=A0A9D4M5Z6_DREPO|nr:hypothetical protein DPMN_034710 [Dreissena polymorpha]